MEQPANSSKSNFIRDKRVEQEVAKFLDKSLYKSVLFTEIERVSDKERQKLGIDVFISSPSLDLDKSPVDEKSQSSLLYLNSSLPTFVLELSALNTDNEEVIGWFLNQSNKTEYYLFVWLDKTRKKEDLIEEDIDEISYCIVSYETLLSYFEKYSLSIEELKIRNSEIREKYKDCEEKKTIYNDKYGNEFHYCYSGQLHEKSINIVIKKRVLFDLSILNGKISRDWKARVFHIYKNFSKML